MVKGGIRLVPGSVQNYRKTGRNSNVEDGMMESENELLK